MVRWRSVSYVGSYAAFNVHRIARGGGLSPGGESHLSIIVEGRAETIQLTHTVPGFGGKRAWFRCPMCGGRRAKLYFVGRLACRECAGLRYRSRSETQRTRLTRKILKIRDKVGGSDSLMSPFPPKPADMWWRTYLRLREQEEEIERWRLAMFLPMLARLHSQITGRPRNVPKI